MLKHNLRGPPEDKMPIWKPGMVNQFNQDDIYVEMTFLRAGIAPPDSGHPKFNKLEQCWEPGPAVGSRFNQAETEQIAKP